MCGYCGPGGIAECGDATGWDPVTGSVEELLRRRVEVRKEVFAGLGIARSEPVDPGETALSRLLVFTVDRHSG